MTVAVLLAFGGRPLLTNSVTVYEPSAVILKVVLAEVALNIVAPAGPDTDHWKVKVPGPVLELPVKEMSEIGSVVGTVDVPVNVVERSPALGDEITAVTPDPAL